ncbi:MAG: hypothetical protein JXA69_20205 [Phycisphaerae bacterium]|nr:hypothetical protein [Phycisphaerae bacterium]
MGVVIIAAIITITVLFVCPFLKITRPHRHPMSTRLRCAANLNNIGTALAMYACDHDNAFPPDLQTLVTEGYLESDRLVCPSAGTANYIYMPGQNWNDAPENVLVYEPTANHDNVFANVLFVDMHVDSVTPTQLKTILAPAGNGVTTTPAQ